LHVNVTYLGAGALVGCHQCMNKGMYFSFMRRITYGGFGRWLPPDHRLRRLGDGNPPDLRTSQLTVEHAKDCRKANRKQTGVCGYSPLLRLAVLYDYDLHRDNPTDICHVFKEVLKKLFQMMKGKRSAKDKDAKDKEKQDEDEDQNLSQSSRQDDHTDEEEQDEKHDGQRKRARRDHKHISRKSVVAKESFWQLNIESQNAVDNNFHTISVQAGRDHGARPFQYTGSMSFNDWHTLIRGTGQVLLCDALPAQQFQVIKNLLMHLQQFLRFSISQQEIGILSVSLIEHLVAFEEIVPETEHAMIVHVLVHYPAVLARFGPSYYYWMYAFERFLSFMARVCHDRAKPEQNMCKAYQQNMGIRCLTAMHAEALRKLFQSSNLGIYLERRLQIQLFEQTAVSGTKFPRRSTNQSTKKVSLTDQTRNKIECDLQENGAQYLVGQVAWRFAGSVKIGGHRRNSKAKKKKTFFAVQQCPLREHLCNSKNIKLFGRFCHFISIEVRESPNAEPKWLNIAKVQLFRPFKTAAFTLPIVRMDSVFPICYIKADACTIGLVVSIYKSPETSRPEDFVVLEVNA
jgi:hypothetical protein